jgi:ankyrin repeat protein
LNWLLEEKLLDVHETDFESGWTVLHRACYYGQLSCALLLLQVCTSSMYLLMH